VVFFWGAYEQTGASLALFAKEQTNLNIIGTYSMPPSFFQSFNSAFIIIFAPIFAWMWLKMGKKQPATPTKMGIGLILLALGFLWIAYGVKDVGAKKVSIIWLTGLYLLHTWGELCLSPIGLSLFNKMSPLRFASLLMAVWFLGNAGGNKMAGVLSALYPEGEKATSFLGYPIQNLYDFFMLFVFMGGLAGVILLLLSKRLQKMMNGQG
jgi:POT family proton-dependent oligopeptide transporter